MLTAPAPDRYNSNSPSARRAALAWPVIVAAVLMLYALGVGWGLIGGLIPSESAYLLMALPCLAPMVWSFSGAWREHTDPRATDEQETGLWLTGVGWLLLACGLVVKHVVVMRALPDAYASQASSPLVPLCIALGVLGLLIGGAVCWLSWKNDTDN